MPVMGEQVVIAYKLLPLTLSSNGTSSVTVRRGFVHGDGNFEVVSEKIIQISADDTANVLDAMPTEGLTRRDDLSLAVYQHLVSIGEVAGTVV